ncbi:MAG: bacillithiol biosynthesis deacetylase BshB1 [Flavobacteriales bacterium]|nr:bacillithiol biosynthesis deacetylase BshB1 [Flavobacteriales bacterium]
MNSVDILAIAAHPDDVEIGAGGTIFKSVKQGYSVAIVDLTCGELGSRGSGEIRMKEATAAAQKLGLVHRECLHLADGFFRDDRESMIKVIEAIRRLRPRIVITNTLQDRHPDHGRAAKLVTEACFYSGLRKIETVLDGAKQEAWRPQVVYYFVQDYYHEPDFVVDVSEYWEQKIEVLNCYSSQFFDPNSKERETPISGKDFFDFLKARAADLGRHAGFSLAEGFITARTPGVNNLFDLR